MKKGYATRVARVKPGLTTYIITINGRRVPVLTTFLGLLAMLPGILPAESRAR